MIHTFITVITNTGRRAAVVRTGTLAILLVVAFSAMLLATPTALAAGPPAAAVLTFVQQTVDIDYGTKISITAVVDTGSQSVATVRALFRPSGGSTVWSYDYPEFEIDGGMVSVTFEISTGPGSYYPPGTEFEIEIEVTHANGEISSARSPDSIEYLDPARDWQRMSGDGYTVVFYGVSNTDVADLIARVNSRIPTLRDVLGVNGTSDFPNFKAVVFPSVKDATPSFPPVSQTATDQFLFAGFAQPQYRLFVQGQMNSTTFVHELAHLYTHEALSSSLQVGLPSWLGEGLARFLETGSSSSSNERLRSSVRPDEFLSLRHMGTVPGKRSDIFIFYPQAGAFVGYLVEKYGTESMANYLAVMNGGQSLLSGFTEVYGKSLYEVENDWRAMFDAAPLAIPSATPEPTRTSAGTSPGTPVPLVDFHVGLASDPASTGETGATKATAASEVPEATVTTGASEPAVAVFLPTVTPRTSIESPEISAGGSTPVTKDDSSPNYVAAGLVIALLIVLGAWLIVARRSKLPKRTASGQH